MNTTAAGSAKPNLLAGRHALVTGGAQGIGAAITGALLLHGARVTIVGRNRESLAKALHTLGDSGSLESAAADVSDSRAVAEAFTAAQRRFGAVHILINCAGQAQSAPILKTDEELWRRMMAVNLDGTFHCTRAALPGMLEAGWGRIVNIASTAGLTGYAYVSAYCASKHAVIGLTRAVALETATKGVTVNAVCPGYTQTDMFEESVARIVAKTGRAPEAVREQLAASNPQKKLIQPQDVANAVAWLCLPGSESITGQAIAVAGGEVM
ncbi:MAG: SDR family NAD(P)-dependent oxidoreductase [Candidatus Acidiferrales bacterium]